MGKGYHRLDIHLYGLERECDWQVEEAELDSPRCGDLTVGVQPPLRGRTDTTNVVDEDGHSRIVALAVRQRTQRPLHLFVHFESGGFEEVEHHHPCLHAVVLALTGHLLQLVTRPRYQHHVHPATGQRQRITPPDAIGRTCDDGPIACIWPPIEASGGHIPAEQFGQAPPPFEKSQRAQALQQDPGRPADGLKCTTVRQYKTSSQKQKTKPHGQPECHGREIF
mmetsp:Transcript_26010/g.64563  ORF Transcript_26010/g.64563 Transcript_26010/m.64563 type:complete len:223 (+) Transcript_26010:1503-2171(+)